MFYLIYTPLALLGPQIKLDELGCESGFHLPSTWEVIREVLGICYDHWYQLQICLMKKLSRNVRKQRLWSLLKKPSVSLDAEYLSDMCWNTDAFYYSFHWLPFL